MIEEKRRESDTEMGFCHEYRGQLEYLTIPAFAQAGFCHAFSTRHGGVSQGELGSLNLGFSRGDERENVLENYRRLTQAIGVSMDSLVLAAQTHTDRIRKVTRADCGEGITKKTFADIDGLMTDETGVTLVTFHADCTPVFLADPIRRAVALVHAGWRGTVQNIAGKAVAAMMQEYGCRPQDILAAIGPGICPQCFETHEDVPNAMMAALGTPVLQHIQIKDNGKFSVDLKGINAMRLEQAGLDPAKIAISRECTSCRTDKYWSHRKVGNNRGSMASVIQLL